MNNIEISAKNMLERFYDIENKYEICIDEAGRGCLFSQVYVACVILPKECESFDGTNIKDSKKFTSKKKLQNVAEYVKEHALAYHIEYVEPDVIDKINILKKRYGYADCIKSIINKLKISVDDCTAIVDEIISYMTFNEKQQAMVPMRSVTVEQGDAKYMGIAAASILAKTARDANMPELCDQYPLLMTYMDFEKMLDMVLNTRRYCRKWHYKMAS